MGPKVIPENIMMPCHKTSMSSPLLSGLNMPLRKYIRDEDTSTAQNCMAKNGDITVSQRKLAFLYSLALRSPRNTLQSGPHTMHEYHTPSFHERSEIHLPPK
ncbi:hypothetical protein Pelo_3813 [Pelomyxa schiedti]|nr:hypothetical protein Pelo_3813 [Pelomyxa schiedti]